MKLTITGPEVTAYEGKNIKDICDTGYTNDTVNHCAHFVAHLMGYTIGHTCKKQVNKPPATSVGASLRANEIFNRSAQVGKWEDKPATLIACLAFVTHKSNVNLTNGTMTDHPKKHIGVLVDGRVYHYSNLGDKVVWETPEKFAKHYSGDGITMYYGSFLIG